MLSAMLAFGDHVLVERWHSQLMSGKHVVEDAEALSLQKLSIMLPDTSVDVSEQEGGATEKDDPLLVE
eukprot:912231-Amphidinium_carterae.1